MKSIIRYIRIAILRLALLNKPSLQFSNNTVIFAPHPDDEIIGCAGLIQTLVEQGFPPHVVIMTGGEGSHRECCNVSKGEIIKERRTLALKAAETLMLPISHIHFLDYSDEHINIESIETEKLHRVIKSLSPKCVFVPHCREGIADHINTTKIISTLIDQNVVIYEYCVWMWYYNVWKLNYKNARILKMSRNQHQLKLFAVNQYVSPLAPCGKPWSGTLPKVFLQAAKWRNELYFKVR